MMKKNIYLIFLIIAAIVLGSLLTEHIASTEALEFLAYGKAFVLEPMTFSFFALFTITFGFSFTITVAQVVLIAVVLFVYYKTAGKLFG